MVTHHLYRREHGGTPGWLNAVSEFPEDMESQQALESGGGESKRMTGITSVYPFKCSRRSLKECHGITETCKGAGDVESLMSRA